MMPVMSAERAEFCLFLVLQVFGPQTAISIRKLALVFFFRTRVPFPYPTSPQPTKPSPQPTKPPFRQRGKLVTAAALISALVQVPSSDAILG